MMKYFGSSGIRGIVNADLSIELAMAAGRAVGSLYSNVLLAMDTRTSSEMIAKAFIAGVLASGGNVKDIGIAPTPVAGYLARFFECAAVITASHNPPEYNGIKLMTPDGSGFSERQMLEIEESIEARKFKSPGYEFIGKYEAIAHLKEAYIEKIVSEFGRIGKRVAVDPGNGAGSHFTPRILRELGCKVLSLNAQQDGTFPWRPSEPSKENLKSLENAVISNGCDAGIANDGDADRFALVDERGKFVEPEVVLCYFAKRFPEGKVVVSIDTTSALTRLIGEERVLLTKTGDVFVSDCLKNSNGVFGGEPSGTYIFPNHSYCPDGIYAAVSFLASIEGSVSQALAFMPQTYTKRESIGYRKEKRSEIERRLKEELIKIPGKLIEVDGIKVVFEDGALLVRFSGTEPKIRVFVEGYSQEACEKIYGLAKDVLGRCLN